MITWPQSRKTFVIAMAAEDVVNSLRPVTVPREAGINGKIIFTGWVQNDRFQIMRYATRINPFQPVAHGRLESPSRGCILVLQYHLLPITRWLLIAGAFVAVLTATVIYQAGQPAAAGAIAGTTLVVGLVAWLNFRLHRQDLETHILRVLQEH
ncbi:MAG: hypothetical protein ACK5V5_13130 [Cyclobacteriaceae bacterium]|jgi:hypothetical protein|nr:hypothetical protein [Flammeovirgaceae bacterium]